ncbi:tRNA dihydrouridine synthase DusB [Ornithinibacter sp.]|uniref:tRNA dihydrouridine synthase DusB n=1 Tax=Ornithinibacter sp. TaxID=2862748 RepID=UPI002BE34561|nr:tRNA dihydrouridine synthase DusB [Ornithinibacter sp.]HOB80289.1 tRNA dihydrouridine synthase DusB [Ornithinibacter sp.]HQA14279.1 tRNA dihydrouridine synthase DusB [Ornithinibacter sp.]HQD68151.1 tRNA dihydrouridine synthase DusB [Ornithinibacter sp.]HQX88615.1 tRNA dihydrouridine synthase DusB [Ornithinibacter sp.]HQZ09311.1 tRNA dihydrouridine synthase DusB [Ornithinibacter sp.]
MSATTAVLPPLHIGRHVIESPVVLAPMAGITNRAFRRLCRESGSVGLAAGGVSGATSLYVSEMVTSRALVERSTESMRLISHDPQEHPRSVQLYSVDPVTAGLAARMLVTEDRADHIDLNFGCPVPKVTRKGGGAALPWKTELFRSIVAAVVREASPYSVPVTVKMRVGIDAEHITYLEAGRIAEAEGVAAVALHGRTASQAYSGQADWSAIARLKEAVTSIPVLGNGDIWSAEDALEMVRQTGCDGVVVGRGCLGRPWLFADLAAAFAGSQVRVRPGLREVTATLRRHTEYLVDFYDGDEQRACRDIRKHIAWYLKGFPAGSTVRHQLALVDSLQALDDLIGTMDLDVPWPGDAAEGQRGRAGSPRVVALPENWLRSRELDEAQAAQVAQAELSVSGG